MLQAIKKYTVKHHFWVVPAVLTLVVSIPVFIWLKVDTGLPHWDMGRHLYNTLQYGRLWHDFLAGHRSLGELLGAYYYYPPFVYQIALIFYIFLGVSQDVAVVSNIFWIFILIYALYNSVSMNCSKKSAVIAVLALFSMPMIIGATHEFQLDLPLTAWVMFTFYLLQKFSNKPEIKYSLLVGLALGLGMLIKWTYLIFILPVAAIFLVQTIVKNKGGSHERRKVFWSILVAVFLAIAVCGVWYTVNRHQIKLDFQANGVAAAVNENDVSGWNFANFSYYAGQLSSQYLLLPLLLLFLAAAVKIIGLRKAESVVCSSLIVIVAGYLILTFLPNKDTRYIMPLAPFIAIVIVSWFNLIKSNKQRMVFAAVAVAIAIINNFSVSSGAFGGSDIKLFNNNYGYIIKGGSYTSAAPKSAVCNIDKVVSAIPVEASARLIGNNPIEFNNWMLAYYLEKSGRVWAGEGVNTSNSNYLVIRLDGSSKSSQTLFDYQNNTLVAANINCADKSLVIVLKNQL